MIVVSKSSHFGEAQASMQKPKREASTPCSGELQIRSKASTPCSGELEVKRGVANSDSYQRGSTPCSGDLVLPEDYVLREVFNGKDPVFG